MIPENTGHSPNAVSMLVHRRQRWPNIETTLGECPVIAGMFDFVGPYHPYHIGYVRIAFL